jgi:UDP-MurNAc hydroxylase
VTPEDFHDIDAIYCSHVHEDHVSWATMERLPRVPVLVGRYAERFLAQRLLAMGFPVRECAHDVAVEVGGGLTVQVVPADDCDPRVCGRWIGCAIAHPQEAASYQIDTLAVFAADGQTIVNVNDVPYALAQQAVARVFVQYGAPDLLCVGYAWAGPWPQCFTHLSPAESEAAAEAKRAQSLAQARAFIDHVQPRAYLPFAGQYTLGGPLVDLNDRRGVPELEDLDDWGDARMVRLNRGAWFDCATGQASAPFTPVSREARVAYRETLRDRPLEHEADPWPGLDDLSALVAEAQRQLWARCLARGFVSDWCVEVIAVWPDDRYQYAIRFQDVDLSTLGSGVLRIELDARLLLRILRRQINMNNVEIGSLARFSRVPDRYDRGSFTALSYWHV